MGGRLPPFPTHCYFTTLTPSVPASKHPKLSSLGDSSLWETHFLLVPASQVLPLSRLFLGSDQNSCGVLHNTRNSPPRATVTSPPHYPHQIYTSLSNNMVGRSRQSRPTLDWCSMCPFVSVVPTISGSFIGGPFGTPFGSIHIFQDSWACPLYCPTSF